MSSHRSSASATPAGTDDEGPGPRRQQGTRVIELGRSRSQTRDEQQRTIVGQSLSQQQLPYRIDNVSSMQDSGRIVSSKDPSSKPPHSSAYAALFPGRVSNVTAAGKSQQQSERSTAIKCDNNNTNTNSGRYSVTAATATTMNNDVSARISTNPPAAIEPPGERVQVSRRDVETVYAEKLRAVASTKFRDADARRARSVGRPAVSVKHNWNATDDTKV